MMIPVYQSINREPDADIPGDCVRATVASIFELNIIQVPHFLLFREEEAAWFNAFWWFFRMFEYDVQCYDYVKKEDLPNQLDIGGYYLASVPSTFPDADHSVIIDSEGIIVHDPCKPCYYLGKNIYNIQDQSRVEVLVLHKAIDNITTRD